MSRLVRVLATQAAQKAVKAALQRQGRKPAHTPAAEIGCAAEAWLRSHPEQFAETTQRVLHSAELRPLLEREMAKRGREIAATLPRRVCPCGAAG